MNYIKRIRNNTLNSSVFPIPPGWTAKVDSLPMNLSVAERSHTIDDYINSLINISRNGLTGLSLRNMIAARNNARHHYGYLVAENKPNPLISLINSLSNLTDELIKYVVNEIDEDRYIALIGVVYSREDRHHMINYRENFSEGLVLDLIDLEGLFHPKFIDIVDNSDNSQHIKKALLRQFKINGPRRIKRSIRPSASLLKKYASQLPDVELSDLLNNNCYQVFEFMKNPTDEEICLYLRWHPEHILKIENPTKDQIIAACTSYKCRLSIIGKIPANLLTPEIQSKILSCKPSFALAMNVDPTVMEAFVEFDGRRLKWFRNPTDEIKLLACKRAGSAIQYIDNPTPEMQLASLKNNIGFKKHIKVLCEEAKEFIFRKQIFSRSRKIA